MECRTAPVTHGDASGRTQISMAIFPTGQDYLPGTLLHGGAIMMVMHAGRLPRSVQSLAIQAGNSPGKGMCAYWNAIMVMAPGLFQNPDGMPGISEHPTVFRQMVIMDMVVIIFRDSYTIQ